MILSIFTSILRSKWEKNQSYEMMTLKHTDTKYSISDGATFYNYFVLIIVKVYYMRKKDRHLIEFSVF